MRFASLQSSGASDYASAGKKAANEAVGMFAVQRKSGPDYTEIAKTGMKARSAEKRAGMEAGAQVAKAGIKAYSDVNQVRIKEDTKAEVRNIDKKLRKAGAVAALGGIAGAAYLATRDNEAGRKRPDGTQAMKDLYAQYKNDRDTRIGDYENSKTTFEPGEYKPAQSSSTTDNTSTGSGSNSTGGNTGGTAGKNTGLSDGWAKLSRVIRHGEGTSGNAGYNTMFTGKQFSDTSRHPRQINRSGRLASDAAGAYQFLSTTWDGARKALDLKDFSPASQEAAGRYLTEQRGVNPDTVYSTKEELGRALDRLAPEWASMPTLRTGTSYYGQGGISLDQAWQIYNGS
jgi:muramidase (phage lysozyme)